MNSDSTKVSPNHLDRDAFLYIRQSTGAIPKRGDLKSSVG